MSDDDSDHIDGCDRPNHSHCKYAKRRLGPEAKEELELFYHQDRFAIHRNRRQEEIEEQIGDLLRELDDIEEAVRIVNECAFVRDLAHNGIDATRRHTIPAYTFTRFPELPVEIRHRIWELALLCEKPRLQVVVATSTETIYDESFNIGTNPSRVEYFSKNDLAIKASDLVLLWICRDSREFASKYLCLFPTCDTRDERTKALAWTYAKIRHDIFFLAEKDWTDFKILATLTLFSEQDKIYPLFGSVMEPWLKLHHLAMDFHKWAKAPLNIWSKLPVLSTFTMIIYASKSFPDDVVELEYPGTIGSEKYWKDPLLYPTTRTRALWLTKVVKEQFQLCRGSIPTWNPPAVKVLLGYCPRYFEGESLCEVDGAFDPQQAHWILTGKYKVLSDDDDDDDFEVAAYCMRANLSMSYKGDLEGRFWHDNTDIYPPERDWYEKAAQLIDEMTLQATEKDAQDIRTQYLDIL